MRWAVLCVVLGACFRPTPPAGAPCDEATPCPEPLACLGGFCGGASADDGSPDADLTCRCSGSTLSCSSGTTTCEIECVAEIPAHCAQIVPSNGVNPTATDALATDIALGDVTVSSDTGEITGGFSRSAGEGVIAGIRFNAHLSMGAPIGVFAFHSLTVNGTVTLVGSRAVVFIVGTDAEITGAITGAGGCDGAQSCPGPGGQAGARVGDAVAGCGGANGTTGNNSQDGGGGGGANGSTGADGGNGGATPGGAGGPTSCSNASLEPLAGGGGGGGGGQGTVVISSSGGGGGGAFQLTVLGTLELRGVIAMNGAGGEGGPVATNSAAGGGGGAGGSILLEAATITFGGAQLAANGGGGGGGGSGNAGLAGHPGANGDVGTVPAAGGLPGATPAAAGGPGAAGTSLAGDGLNGGNGTNGGGGGGGIGRIRLRALVPSATNVTSSPAPQVDVIETR